MTRLIIPSYFVKLVFLNHLTINDKTLRELLGDMRLKNLLTLREPIYPSLIKVFYLNMLISSSTGNKIFINVGGVQITFDVGELNRILRILNEGFQVFTFVQKIEKPWYNVLMLCETYVGDLIYQNSFVTLCLKRKRYPLQVRVLHSIV